MLTIRISNNSSSYVGYKQDTETVPAVATFSNTFFTEHKSKSTWDKSQHVLVQWYWFFELQAKK